MTARETPPKYLPTPAQIAAECQQIRAEWSEYETMTRFVGPKYREWYPHECESEIGEPWEDE